MTRLVLLLLLFPLSAFASNSEIENYMPPPMFGEHIRDTFPPLPPRRPTKINVPQSYIEYLRKYGKPPALIQYHSLPPKHDLAPENLIQPTAQDILEQINPQ